MCPGAQFDPIADFDAYVRLAKNTDDYLHPFFFHHTYLSRRDDEIDALLLRYKN